MQTRYPCHCQPEHQAYSDFFADIDLVFSGGVVAQQIEPDLHHYHFRMDSRTLLGHRHHPLPPTDSNRRDVSGRGNQPREPYTPMDHQRTTDCYCFPPGTGCTLIYLLASVAIRNRHDSLLYPVMGRRTRIDFMDLPQEVLKSHPRNKEEFKRIERINVKGDNGCAYPTTVSTPFPFTFLCTCT